MQEKSISKSDCPFTIDECRLDWRKKLAYDEWLREERRKDRLVFVCSQRSAYYFNRYKKKCLEEQKMKNNKRNKRI